MSDDDEDDAVPPEEDADGRGFGFAAGGDRENGDGPAGENAETDRDDLAGDSPEDGAPLDDLVERTRAAGDDPDGDVMDAFDDVSVDGVDGEELWSQLEQESVESGVKAPASESERDVRVVSKRDYCMRCQFFSAPPEVRCTHERGEILEMADTDRFKLADCPILRGEEELENLRR